jgi:hypothetical protein
MRYLIITLLLALNSCVGMRVPSTNFEIVGNTPVVKVNISGKDVYFFVDTGASASMIDASYAEYLEIPIDSLNPKYFIGFGGLSATYPTDSVNVSISGVRTKMTFYTSDLSSVMEASRYFRRDINIAGYLGADFLINNKVQINYRDHKIYIEKFGRK